MSLFRSLRLLGTLCAAALTLTLSAAGSTPAGAVGTAAAALAAASGAQSLPAGAGACLSTQAKPSSPLAACGRADSAASEATVALPEGSTACASTAAKPSSDTATCSRSQKSGAAAAASTFVLKLVASPVSLAPGGTTTLTAISNQDVTPTPFFIQVYDATAGTFVAGCGSGTTCAASVTQSGSAVRNYVAFVTDAGKTFPPAAPQATSNTVTVSWLTISLGASPLDLRPGDTTTIAASTGVDVGPTPFFIEIFDVTAGTVLAQCGFGTTCSTSVTQSGSAVRSYTAFVSEFGTTLPPPGIRAQSATIPVTWMTLSLTASATSLPAGQGAASTVTLTATPSVNIPASTGLFIEIFESNTEVFACGGGSVCTGHDARDLAGRNFYSALVTSAFESALPTASVVRAVSNSVDVTWTATSATVPNVLGRDPQVAASIITGAGLVASVSSRAFCIEPGAVHLQSPSAGTVVPPGSTVSITVDSGCTVTVPSVVGNDPQTAGDIITAAGLVPVTGTEVDCTAPLEIVKQEPSAGTVVSLGSTVNLTEDIGTRDICDPK